MSKPLNDEEFFYAHATNSTDCHLSDPRGTLRLYIDITDRCLARLAVVLVDRGMGTEQVINMMAELRHIKVKLAGLEKK